MWRVRFLGLVLVVACGDHSPSCKDAVSKAVGQLRSSSNYAATMIGWCVQQEWSGEVRTCVSNAKSEPELSACVQQDKKARAADAARVKAAAAASEAEKGVATAKDKVDKLVQELADAVAKVGKADEAVTAAKTDADRTAAKVKAADAAKDKADVDARLAAARAAVVKAEKAKQAADECAENPLAKGC